MAVGFRLPFPLDLRLVAFFLGFLLAAVEASSLPTGVVGGLLVGFFISFLFHIIFLFGVTVERATAFPRVLLDFVASPLSFFARLLLLLPLVVSPGVAFFRFNASFVSTSFASSD